MPASRYPRLFIRSKSELAKHISRKNFSREKALTLINESIGNFDHLWKDSKRSDPVKEKYVRSAKGTRLGVLLQKINWVVLAPHDKKLPGYIFGGIAGRDHVKGAAHLIGRKRYRVLLKADIKRFFEQISYERVAQFFYQKCGCSKETARLLADLCCVPSGPKGSRSETKTLARGFATSSRLAVWCNLDRFIELERLVQKRLKGKDPRIAIYVDDIGVTASRATKEEMEALYEEIKGVLMADSNQLLPLNDDKKNIVSHTERMEHLGVGLERNRLSLSAKTFSKRSRLKRKLLQKDMDPEERAVLKRKYKSFASYKRYIERN